MLLRTKVVHWPAQEEIDADLNEFGHLSNKTRAEYGEAGAEAGSPDFGQNDHESDAVDAIANILHWISYHGYGDPKQVLDRAILHFRAEASRTG